jgi:hypothetical protein
MHKNIISNDVSILLARLSAAGKEVVLYPVARNTLYKKKNPLHSHPFQGIKRVENVWGSKCRKEKDSIHIYRTNAPGRPMNANSMECK